MNLSSFGFVSWITRIMNHGLDIWNCIIWKWSMIYNNLWCIYDRLIYDMINDHLICKSYSSWVSQPRGNGRNQHISHNTTMRLASNAISMAVTNWSYQLGNSDGWQLVATGNYIWFLSTGKLLSGCNNSDGSFSWYNSDNWKVTTRMASGACMDCVVLTKHFEQFATKVTTIKWLAAICLPTLNSCKLEMPIKHRSVIHLEIVPNMMTKGISNCIIAPMHYGLISYRSKTDVFFIIIAQFTACHSVEFAVKSVQTHNYCKYYGHSKVGASIGLRVHLRLCLIINWSSSSNQFPVVFVSNRFFSQHQKYPHWHGKHVATQFERLSKRPIGVGLELTIACFPVSKIKFDDSKCRRHLQSDFSEAK